MTTGRPLRLHETIDVRDRDGNVLRTITRGERVIEYLRTGSHFDHACTAAGITAETGYEYKRRAAQARIRTTGRTLEQTPLSDNERDLLAFSDAVAAAEGEAAINMGLQRQRLMQGGINDVKTTTRVSYETVMVPDADNPGELVPLRREVSREVTTVESPTLPDGAMIRWWFERRFPKLYGRTVEIVDPGRQLTDEERAEPLVDALKDFAASPEGQRLAEQFDAADAEQVNVEKAVKANGKKARPKRIRDERGRIVRTVAVEPDGDDDTAL